MLYDSKKCVQLMFKFGVGAKNLIEIVIDFLRITHSRFLDSIAGIEFKYAIPLLIEYL